MIDLKVKEAKTLKEKAIGLLGTSKPFALFFQTHFGIHTFGMKYPIDVLILDRDDHVKAAKTHLPPNQLYFWNPLFSKVIELPAGTIKRLHIHPNERVKLWRF